MNRSLGLGVAFSATVLAAFLPARPADPPDLAGPPGSVEPSLSSTARGGLLATWFEPRGEGRWALRIAERSRERWAAPLTVVEGDRFFVNWADFPSAAETVDGRWIVYWLEKTAAKAYAYHVRVSTSTDRGRSWSAPTSPHSDTSATEHGFVAILPGEEGGAELIWLDGRQTADPKAPGAMALAWTMIGRDGKPGPDAILDSRVCDCCQTAIARTTQGPVVVYRDRTEGEVRDMSIVRRVDGRWTAPAPVARDGWVYKACPVNGPSVAALGTKVAVAWFTGVDSTPQVKLARSDDAGATFGRATRVDDGNPLGRAEIELLPDGSALVVWLEIVGEAAEWRVKRIDQNGRVLARWVIGSAPRTRAAGFARAALASGHLFVAWTEPGERGGIRVQRVASPGG
ncbi:MAG: exo-alpha-sialidase [Gemmatimonadales bacterium]|nr:exo-alpha-sialidase [Gemmatimonadales bacterium]